MKTLKKMRFVPLLLTPLLVAMMVLPGTLMAYGPTVDLLSTSNFAVLANTTITNVPTTNISGDAGVDIGVASGSEIGGGIVLNGVGTTHSNDALAIKAQTDLVTVYNDAVGRTDTATVPVELGGTTLTSGVYSSGGVLQITGTLTLDAQGDPNAVFIFKSTATLITASGSNVSLINGARYCRVFWVVPSSATLGTNSTFVGHIFAMASITANSGATIQGQLLARTGAVTLNANTISNGLCAAIAAAEEEVVAEVVAEEEVAAEEEVVEEEAAAEITVTGGEIPITSTPWYNVLLAGAALTLIGAVSWLIIRKKIYE